MTRIAAIVLGAALAWPASLAWAADNLPIAAFYGTFKGGGVAENRDSVYFQTTARDFDVTIGPAGEGFRIQWTTVLRRGGTPTNPEIRRNSTAKVMVPAGRQGVYRCADSGDPLDGDNVLCWARIAGPTLSMFLLNVGNDGSYVLQQYDRTLSGSGMKLVFTSMRNGRDLRTVSGHLVKTEKATP